MYKKQKSTPEPLAEVEPLAGVSEAHAERETAGEILSVAKDLY